MTTGMQWERQPVYVTLFENNSIAMSPIVLVNCFDTPGGGSFRGVSAAMPTL